MLKLIDHACASTKLTNIQTSKIKVNMHIGLMIFYLFNGIIRIRKPIIKDISVLHTSRVRFLVFTVGKKMIYNSRPAVDCSIDWSI